MERAGIGHPAARRQGRRPVEARPLTASPAERALAHVAARAAGSSLDPALRVTLHFHPDRLARGVPILRRMAVDGVYRSQFETGTSNGGLTAYEGGDRWRWESRIFGGAYDRAPASERPTYGSLNHRRRPAGGSPRFGSAFFRLTVDSLRRTTFCYPDSNWEPEHFGVADRMSLIELADAEAAANGPLDDYIEAHVHGGVRFDRDVEALVLDPCYRGTAVEAQGHDLPCCVEWHDGFRLSVDELRRHPDYRGLDVVECGVAIAEDGWLDPRIIGDAARNGTYDEQLLKRVWHYVARFGGPHGA